MERPLATAMITDQLASADLRRWAMQCAAQADNPGTSGDNRDRLLKMQAALLDLAHTQEWLEGRQKSNARGK
jgi:hypothetical protein